MIESCTKKRMVLGITLLGGLTILVLIVESHWTVSPNNKPYLDSFDSNLTCPAGEKHKVISECHPCTSFEITSQNVGACAHAFYKEIIECDSGKTITRSCDRVAWLEERTFWKFESLMLAFALLSCVSVFWRENVLRQRIIRKVAKQLRASV